MTPDEALFVTQVDEALGAVERRIPSAQRLRQIPMDMIAVAVMRQLARDGVAMPFSAPALEHAVSAVLHRHLSVPSAVVIANT